MNKIKVLALFVVCAVSSCFPDYADAQTTKEKEKLSLFIIGNSFSDNASRYLDTIARERGYAITFGRAEIGGGSLEQHWKAAEAYELDSLSPAGRPYNGESLRMLLNRGVWKIVTLQQYSFLSSDSSSYSQFLTNLIDYIKQLQPQAEIVLHQTWAYRKDSPGFSMVDRLAKAKSQKEMWEKSRSVYHSYAQALRMRIIPTGDAFWAVDSDRKLGYEKDANFNFGNPVYPQLPDQNNSLHVGYYWDDSKELSSDFNHASNAGCYLGSLVWYAILFNCPPKKVKFKPDDVPAAFAKSLRAKASHVVRLRESFNR